MDKQAETPRCPDCRIGFTTVGERSAEKRFTDHLGRYHGYKCYECDLDFLSIPHLKFHINYTHDTRCGICASFCGLRCTEELGRYILRDKVMNSDRADRIKNLEEEIMQENELKSGIDV